MTSEFKIPQATIDNQNKAADPKVSAWVAANAGAGKTKVLADRVVRLLLAGTPPSRILCLTFTKAAAANMSLRVIKLLGDWVTMDDEQLRETLENLQGTKINRDELHLARRLFAQAVETPGGLKIETIHAFCERILHLAPFEAHVPPQFDVIEETATKDLIIQSIETILNEALEKPESSLAQAFHQIRMDLMGEDLVDTITAVLKLIPAFIKNGTLKQIEPLLQTVLGICPDDTVSRIQNNILERGIPLSKYDQIIETLRKGKSTDIKQADALQSYMNADGFEDKWAYLSIVFFKKDGDPKDEARIITKGIDDDTRSYLVDERDRLTVLRDKLRSAHAIERTKALFCVSERIFHLYSEAKKKLSVLNFDDLISRTLDVLENTGSSWILYKLDRGIDHILIDEAQDTSPEQWRILRKLTEEFSAGQGQSGDKRRTIFAVGDPKQSIYSFQGAKPKEFESSRRYWERRFHQASQIFETVNLTLSFRTAESVLEAVDATFKIEENYKGLGFDQSQEVGTIHASARASAPGVVEIWPTEQPLLTEEPVAGIHPVNAPDPASAPILLARRIANAVRIWTTRGDNTGRIWKAGDILILVRKRGTAFEAVIRALKKTGIPVSGQDRLNITQHIAVQDLISIGRTILCPEDDLSLAEALKSPLTDFSDEDLECIAALRTDEEPLIKALERAAQQQHGKAQEGLAAFTLWQHIAANQTPFSFYTALLGMGGARAAFISRMGQEAADAIDAFLSFARTSELSGTASLAFFIAQFEKSLHTIKRDMETQRDEVRVMTIHGAKGLEAPLVVVIDGGDTTGQDPVLLEIETEFSENPLPLWVPLSKNDSAMIRSFRQQSREQSLEEHHRLLYVAMTRAKDRLVIASHASGRSAELSAQSWTTMIQRGVEHSGKELRNITTEYGKANIWQDEELKSVPCGKNAFEPDETSHFDPLPDWLKNPVANEPNPLPPLRPSLLTAKPHEETRNIRNSSVLSRQRGNLIHALLEHLPLLTQENQRAAGLHYLSTRAPHLQSADHVAMVDQALSVMMHESLSVLFSSTARTEVAVSGMVQTAAGLKTISGRIDRLAITDHAVFIADFKTDPHPPHNKKQIRFSHLLQISMYGTLLRQIFPTKKIIPFLVYTAGPILWEITDTEMKEALDAYQPQ